MKTDTRFLQSFVSSEELTDYTQQAIAALQTLKKRTGAGNDFLGWLDLPLQFNPPLANEIMAAVNSLKKLDAVVVVGIGGSYLGARAVIDALAKPFDSPSPELIYAGHHLSQPYHDALLKYLETRSFGIVVISKSGTTTEPAIAFRLLRNLLIQKEGREKAARYTIAITDKKRGALRSMADVEGYRSFVIADNVGGRFSVLSPVGLVPIALSGIAITELMAGARAAVNDTMLESEGNPAVQYAAIRNCLMGKGKTTEIMVSYEPGLHYIAEWWKQLYGESEGKQHLGLFPASVQFTTDLHSLGQYIQDGQRMMFETILSVEKAGGNVFIPPDNNDADGLNYLAGKSMNFVNATAMEATAQAHVDGGVPVLRLEIPEINAYQIGYLLYMFEVACAISGYMLGVNPFDQPGVEAYKKNMFRMLGKE